MTNTEKNIIGSGQRKTYFNPDTTPIEEIIKQLDRLPKQKPEEKPKEQIPIINPVSFQTNIVKSDYIQIPNEKFVIAIAETNFNLNYENAHKTTIKQGFEIPSPYEFMKFHNHIIDCYKNKKPIFDASGNPILEQTKNNLYTELTSKCWTWLNGKFNISENKKTIEYIKGIDSNDNLITKQENLEDYLMEDCYIDFTKLNKQGLALINSKYSAQDFSKGKNIYFWHPGNKLVARFYAYSDVASLHCNWSPSNSYSSLGVRAVKEKKIK